MGASGLVNNMNSKVVIYLCLIGSLSWLYRCTYFNEILHGNTLIVEESYSLLRKPTQTQAKLEWIKSQCIKYIKVICMIGFVDSVTAKSQVDISTIIFIYEYFYALSYSVQLNTQSIPFQSLYAILIWFLNTYTYLFFI